MVRLETDDADVAELADALDLGSSSERSEGSSPFIRTFNCRKLHELTSSCSKSMN